MRDVEYRFGLAGSAAFLPSRRVSSDEVDLLSALPPGTIKRQFRIAARHWAGPEETSSAMAAAAGAGALSDAGWLPGDIDVIIGACGVMEQPIPGTSVLVQRRLGLGNSGIPAFDVNATCLSFLMAFDRVLAGFALGEWRRALIVSADIASAALDFANPEESAIFGDGAAAIALEAGGPHARLAHQFQTWGDGADHCRLEAGGTRLRPHDDLDGFLARSRFRMDGRNLFRATATRLDGFLVTLAVKAGVPIDQVDSILPHQASAAALEHFKRAVPDGHARTVDIFARQGNQIATSLPSVLHHARTQAMLKPGTTSLMIGSSAGISLGGAIIRW